MRVLIFGDSITQGFWDSQTGWVGYLAEYYATKHLAGEMEDPPSIFNLGVSADTSRNVLDRFDAETRARAQNESTSFIFSIGTNDVVVENETFWATPEEYAENLTQLVKKANKYSHKILFVGIAGCDEAKTLPVSWGDYWYSNERLAKFNNVLKNFCKNNNLSFVDIFDLFKNQEELLFDGLHPNTKGHQLIYEKVKPELEKLSGN